MSRLAFRLWHDTGAASLFCKIIRHHRFLPSSYRDESCTRCPLIRPRTDR